MALKVNMISKYKKNYCFTCRILVAFLMAALLLTHPVSTYSRSHNDDDSLYLQLNRLDNQSLISEAESLISRDTLLLKATVALTIVSNRYYEMPSDSALRKDAIYALTLLGNFYYAAPLDFLKSYKYLSTARQIAEEYGNDEMLARIYLSLSGLFHNSTVNSKMEPATREFIIKGMDAALRNKDNDVMSTIILVMCTVSVHEGKWGDFKPYADSYIHYMSGVEYNNKDFFLNVVRACDSFINDDYKEADRLLEICKNNVNNEFVQGRIYELNIYDLLAYINANNKNYKKAKDTYQSIIDKSYRYNMPIYAMSAYQDLHLLYKDNSQIDSSNYYYGKFLFLKDTLENKTNFGGVEKMEFMSEIDRINDEVKELSMKRQKERKLKLMSFMVLIAVLLVLLSLLYVYLNLKRNHRNLFRRNEEMLQLSAQHKLVRDQWEKERKELENRLDELARKNLPDNVSLQTDAENAVNVNNADDGKDLTDANEEETLKRIYAKILEVMENSKEIYEQGFSMHDLSKMLKSSPRNVSKAINVCHKSNFHQMLNEYRIREVMRIMHDKDFCNYTVEGISEKVGFRSRTSFSTLFKKTTGLTPAEYMRMAHDSKV